MWQFVESEVNLPSLSIPRLTPTINNQLKVDYDVTFKPYEINFRWEERVIIVEKDGAVDNLDLILLSTGPTSTLPPRIVAISSAGDQDDIPVSASKFGTDLVSSTSGSPIHRSYTLPVPAIKAGEVSAEEIEQWIVHVFIRPVGLSSSTSIINGVASRSSVVAPFDIP